jgi:hypothetical protein
MDGNFSVDRGYDAYGNHTQVIVEGDQLVRKTTFDAEPLLREAHAERVATEGKRWGEGVGTKVGTIPMAVYATFLTKPAEERQKFLLQWLRENPAFVTFDKFLKK